MKKLYVSVCKNVILSNLKHGTNKPAIRASWGKYGKPQYLHEWQGTANVVIRMDMARPMPWGARVWIELTP